MDFTHEKGTLRETITARRSALDETGWRKLDASRLTALLGQLPDPGVIAIYASRQNEPDTLTAVEELLTQIGRASCRERV